MNKNIAVFLCDLTGIMAMPWRDAGYECYLFDAQHPSGLHWNDNLKMFTVGGFLKSTNDVFNIVDIRRVHFVFGFPECTDLAVSGSRHFYTKYMQNPDFQNEAMELVYLCRDIGQKAWAVWGLENPVSVISSFWRKPDYSFHPFEYGGYLPENDIHPIYPEYINARDAYPKKTCLWTSYDFVMPEKKPVAVDEGFSVQYKKLGGKSLKTKNIRSATPRGFALAVFEANKK